MAEEFGANIASKAGDGEANIFHWEGVQKTINDLYTRDLYHQKRVQDEYIKSQAQLQTEAKGIRAADIPDFQKAYGNFRDASMKLMDRKVQHDPVQRAYYTKLKDDSYIDGMSLRGLGDEVKKTIGSYKNNWVQNQGLNASDNYHENMNSIEGMSSKQIRATNADDVSNFFTPKDDTPSDLPKKILGNNKIVEQRDPLLDPKGQRMGDKVSKYAIGSEYPLGLVANNALTELKKSRSLTVAARNEFGSLAPEQAKTFIDNANQLIKQETPQAPPLPYDYVGYQAAKWVNQARTKVLTGDPETKYDALWMDNHNNQQQQANQSRMFAHTDANQRKLFAHEDARDANKAKIAAASYADVDVTPVYNALTSGDREKSMKALSAVAANNPDKPIPVTISRYDILDPQKRKELLANFGIPEQKFKNDPGDNEQNKRDKTVQAILTAINNVSGGDKISPADLDRGKIVGAFIHTGQVNEYDANHVAYTGTKQTRLPLVINPQVGNADRFKSAISNIAVRKNKREMQQQDADLEAVGGGGAPAPAATTTPAAASGKWAKYKRH